MARDLNIDIKKGDPEPSDPEARAAYVANVANFFTSYGTQKIDYLIANLARELISPLNKPEDDVRIKATINALSLILDWADTIVAEHMQNQMPS